MDTTLIYRVVLFVHVLGVLGLVAVLTIEGVSLRGLRRSAGNDDALMWIGVGRLVQRFAPASLGLIVVTGLYMMATSWGAQGWILVSLGSLIAVAAIGGLLTGTRMARMGPAAGRAVGPLSDQLRAALRDPILMASFRVRLAIVIGIALLMSVKPSVVVSLLVVVAAAAIGVLASLVGPGHQQRLTEAHGPTQGVREQGNAS